MPTSVCPKRGLWVRIGHRIVRGTFGFLHGRPVLLAGGQVVDKSAIVHQQQRGTNQHNGRRFGKKSQHTRMRSRTIHVVGLGH